MNIKETLTENDYETYSNLGYEYYDIENGEIIMKKYQYTCETRWEIGEIRLKIINKGDPRWI